MRGGYGNMRGGYQQNGRGGGRGGFMGNRGTFFNRSGGSGGAGGGGGMGVGGGGHHHHHQGHHSGRGFFKHTPKPFIPHVCFDFIQAENAFQRVKPASTAEDKTLADAIIKRNQDLTPTPNEQTQLLNLVTNVQTILDNLILSPGDFDACQIEEIRQVGSFKKGTLLMSSNKLVADMCVILKTLPTQEAVKSLGNKVLDLLKPTIVNPLELAGLQLTLNARGFEILSAAVIGVSTVDVAVQVLVTTQYHNLRKLDPTIHLDPKVCQTSLHSVKHARWFEESASHSSIKVLIRILKDIRSRFDGLAPLNPWIIDLIAHHASTNGVKQRGEVLPIQVAFKRVFQLISSGFFLPGSAGIIDPTEQSLLRVHTTMTLEQQDIVCYTTQTLLRILAHGGYKSILGFEGDSSIAIVPAAWDGVIVIPSSKAFEPPKESEPEPEPEHELEPESEADAAATAGSETVGSGEDQEMAENALNPSEDETKPDEETEQVEQAQIEQVSE